MTESDLFSKNWFTILTDAMMHRIQKVDHNEANTIVVRKEVFDDLVKIGEVAARLNLRPHLPPQKPLRFCISTETGTYSTVIEMPGYIKAVATGRTLLESIKNAVFEYDNKLHALID